MSMVKTQDKGSKLDPRAIKCAFVGYFYAQMGYNSSSIQEIVSKDVTFCPEILLNLIFGGRVLGK